MHKICDREVKQQGWKRREISGAEQILEKDS